MQKKTKEKKDYSRYKVEEILATLKKDEKSHWGKYILRCSFDDGTPTIDIRNMCFKEDGKHVVGKGIALSNKEADQLTNEMISHGFGDTDVLEKEIERRKKLYGFKGKEES